MCVCGGGGGGGGGAGGGGRILFCADPVGVDVGIAFVCTLSPEWMDFIQTYTGTTLGGRKELIS